MSILIKSDIIGLVRPSVDVHTLGISSFSQLVEGCGWRTEVGNEDVGEALLSLKNNFGKMILRNWLKESRITILCFSYRLDPSDGVRLFDDLIETIRALNLFDYQGGKLKKVFFAGLPDACIEVKERYRNQVDVFYGDETPNESLNKIGIPSYCWPKNLNASIQYDEDRMTIGRELIASEAHNKIYPIDRSGYPEFGKINDTLMARIAYSKKRSCMPLMRAHVGPYHSNRLTSVRAFLNWSNILASTGFLDILSIGTSQLTQSAFGEDWSGLANGGGVQINSEEEYRSVWESSRPMLVRTYAGTKNVPELARMYEKNINMAWHALSFWWFCETDGRGKNSLKYNLEEHINTLKFIAKLGKPFEPNIPHHFAFRGSDDVTFVVSAVIAARVAKRLGIKNLVLQFMLNTPKSTWGFQDLAKARTMLYFVRKLETRNFQVFFQPRAGLDFFSHNTDKAMAQLASVTALMDDIDPHNAYSPDLIHVVSYSEGAYLATPSVVDESVKITMASLSHYRQLRKRGLIDDMSVDEDVLKRTSALIHDVQVVLDSIEKSIVDPYSPSGLYKMFISGFFPVPDLWGGRHKYRHAVNWKTKMVNGSSCVVDETGALIPVKERCNIASAVASQGQADDELCSIV